MIAALGGDDAEPVALVAQDGEQRRASVERLEVVVQRLVVRPVHLDQLVDAVGIELAHLAVEPGAADRGAHLDLVHLGAEHRLHGVPHRREDDRPGVDQRAVEVEEDDAVAHVAIVAATAGTRCPVSRRARGTGPTGGAVVPASLRAGLQQAANPSGSTRASFRRASAPCGGETSRR